MEIGIQSNNITYKDSTFYVKGGDVKFATSYIVVNENSGNSETFNFDHSTGSEWDRKTKWIYKNNDESLTLVVGNEEVSNTMIDDYAKAKMR